MKFVKDNRERENKLEQAYYKYAQGLYNTAFRLLQNNEDALEIIQETFLKALNGFSLFRNEAKIQTWLYRIVINLCYDRLKKDNRITYIPEEKIIFHIDKNISATDPEFTKEQEEKILKINKAIESLTLKQKTIFTLKVYNELSYEEIAKIMKVKVGTAKATFFQTVGKLKNIIELMEKKNEINEI
ncbi:MAG: RNA polymerase sigma factor [Candidatus Omnitrophica bacterium]|jgi:RNA polymerase sigma-70 factor (ECF subfamily)|nr:RNA polymerase sigma factor [Candidatus Omnitrophota bacterium]